MCVCVCVCVCVYEEVCGEPWHVGTHVDPTDAFQTLPLPTHSHTQTTIYREAPSRTSREPSTYPYHTLRKAGVLQDRVTLRPRTRSGNVTPTLRLSHCVCLVPAIGHPLPGGKSHTGSGRGGTDNREVAEPEWEGWMSCRNLGAVTRWHRVGSLPGFECWLVPFASIANGKHPSLSGPQFPFL